MYTKAELFRLSFLYDLSLSMHDYRLGRIEVVCEEAKQVASLIPADIEAQVEASHKWLLGQALKFATFDEARNFIIANSPPGIYRMGLYDALRENFKNSA